MHSVQCPRLLRGGELCRIIIIDVDLASDIGDHQLAFQGGYRLFLWFRMQFKAQKCQRRVTLLTVAAVLNSNDECLSEMLPTASNAVNVVANFQEHLSRTKTSSRSALTSESPAALRQAETDRVMAENLTNLERRAFGLYCMMRTKGTRCNDDDEMMMERSGLCLWFFLRS